MNELVALPVAVPVVAAAAGLVAGPRPRARRILGVGGHVVVLAVAATLVAATATGRTFALQVGGWPPGAAIVLVADRFPSLMLTVAALMTVVCVLFAAARGEDGDALFHPLVSILHCGVAGSFLTGDLFNLFVFFEVMLIASYVLLHSWDWAREAAARIFCRRGHRRDGERNSNGVTGDEREQGKEMESA